MGTVAVRGASGRHGDQSLRLFSRRSGSREVFIAILDFCFHFLSFQVDYLVSL